VPSTTDFNILYKGEILDESDLDVLLEIFHLIRDQLAVGSNNYVVEISARKFLGLLKRCESSGRNVLLLWHSIRRLSEARIRIVSGDFCFDGQFFDGCSMDRKSRRYEIVVNPDISKLFESGRWAELNMLQRRTLRRMPLSLWLHRFYSSFEERTNFQYNLKTLSLLTMSSDRTLFGFRRNVKKALGALRSACWIGSVDCNDIVCVTR
jgi:hypothetical protein